MTSLAPPMICFLEQPSCFHLLVNMRVQQSSSFSKEAKSVAFEGGCKQSAKYPFYPIFFYRGECLEHAHYCIITNYITNY